jgi:hypothetical protein
MMTVLCSLFRAHNEEHDREFQLGLSGVWNAAQSIRSAKARHAAPRTQSVLL